MRYWFFLFIAIISEVIGTLAMKYTAHGHVLIGFSVMYCMLILSFTVLAMAVKKIPLVVAYGAWESFGLIFITLFSRLLFAEPLNWEKLTAIACLIIGIFLLNAGTIKDDHVT